MTDTSKMILYIQQLHIIEDMNSHIYNFLTLRTSKEEFFDIIREKCGDSPLRCHAYMMNNILNISFGELEEVYYEPIQELHKALEKSEEDLPIKKRVSDVYEFLSSLLK